MATLQRLIEITPHTTITDISLVRRNDILQTLSGNYYIVDSAVHTSDGDTFLYIVFQDAQTKCAMKIDPNSFKEAYRIEILESTRVSVPGYLTRKKVGVLS